MAKIFVYGDREKQKNYAAALEGCGMEGLFTLDLSLAAGCDGLLLPGGGDISPARYGQENLGSGEPEVLSRTLPGGEERNLVVCRKLRFTPRDYPRHGGTIAKHPL